MKRTTSWLLALLLLGAAPALADSKVKGTVTNPDGKPIAGAKVRLEPEKGDPAETETDETGSYVHRGLKPTSYTMTIEKDGFIPHVVEGIKVRPGSDQEIDVSLESLAEKKDALRREILGESYGEAFDAFQAGDYEKSLEAAEAIVAERPDEPQGYEIKGKSLVALKRFDESVPVLEKLVGMEGAGADAKEVLAGAAYNAGAVAYNAGKTDEALAHWEKAIAAGFADPQVHYLAGMAYLSRQEMAKSKEHLEAYLQKSPEAENAGQAKLILAEIQKLEANAR